MTFRFERIHNAPGHYRYYLTGPGINGSVEHAPSAQLHRQLTSRGFDRDFTLTVLTGLGVLRKDTEPARQGDDNVRMRAVASYHMGGTSISVYSCSQKGSHFFNGFSFFRLVFDGKNVDIYEVGFGHKGIYWCVYADGVPVTVFSMDMVAKGHGSGYTVYCENGTKPELLAIVGVLMDITHNPPGDGYNTRRTLTTWQKALKEKFPVAFMARHQE